MLFVEEIYAETMPIKQGEWDEIDKRINAAIKPTGWKKARERILSWGTPIAIVGVGVTLLGITIASLSTAFVHLREETEFRTNTKRDLHDINASLARLLSSSDLRDSPNPGAILPQLLRVNLYEKNSDLGFKTAENLAKIARERRIESDPTLIAKVGHDLFTRKAPLPADLREVAWNATTELLNYCSFVRQPQMPSLAGGVPNVDVSDAYVDVGKIGKPGGSVRETIVGLTERKNAARAVHLGDPDKSSGSVGPALIVEDGSGSPNLILDGHLLKQIVYRGIEIRYDGGPLILDKVYFVDCTFDIARTPLGAEFAKSVFASMPSSFDSSKVTISHDQFSP